MVKHKLKKLLAGLLAAAVMIGGNNFVFPVHAGDDAPREEEAEVTRASGILKGATVAKPGENVSGVKLPDGYYNRKVVGYFPNYAINSDAHDHFSIVDLQWDKLTHVQYAFVIADENTFEMKASDQENDLENKFEDREFYHKGEKIEMDESLGYYGQFNLMHTMMEKYPDVTVLASTGGWAASRSLWLVTDSEANMRKFASSAVEFVRKYGFDGIDIDFEFPSETSGSGNPGDFDLSESRRSGISDRYTQLIQILRETFDAAAKEDNKYYWVTSAVSASSWVLGGQTNSDFLDYLDFVSIMSYDYHGGWNTYVENQANIYPDPADTETTQMALPTLGFDWSYKYYRGKIQSEKILMGVPYYTRGWSNVSGGDGTGLHGSSGTPATGNENIWCDLDTNEKEVPAGANPLWHVMNLMQEDSNYEEVWDDVGKVPHIWNSATKTFLTFENTRSVQERINYVEENNLGGVLIWVMHGDYDYDEAAGKYVVGDTLTTMFHDQFAAMDAAQITSDIDLDGTPLDFSVDFGGKYDHPNYTYSVKVTNNTAEEIPAGWTLTFDLPNSAVFTSSWGGTYSVEQSPKREFSTVSLSAGEWQALGAGETVEMQGMIKLNFAGAKNFKLNGRPMKSAVEAEKIRLGLGDLQTPTVSVTGVSLNKDTLELAEGQSERLTAVVAPSNASNKSLTWSSSDLAVAEVSTGGMVTAKNEGTATITVKTADGGKSAVCAVTVVKKTEDTVAVDSVTIDPSELSLKVGAIVTLTPSISPSNASNQKVIWTTSDRTVASVVDGTVIAEATGTATITVTTEDGNKTAKCVITVTNDASSSVAVTGVSLNKSDFTLEKGVSEKIEALIVPGDATNQNVSWSSSNPSAASVSQDGIVTAVSVGTAVITARTADGGKEASCKVTVTERDAKTVAVTGVSLNTLNAALSCGEVGSLTAAIEPADATIRNVFWKSSDQEIVFVSSEGSLLARKEGTVTITVTTADGSYKAECTVTVAPQAVTGVSLSQTYLSLAEGISEKLTAVVSPENAKNQEVIFSSTDEDVASVSPDGIVTAHKVGTATIKVVTADGAKEASCKVDVTERIPGSIAVTGVSLDQTSLELKVGGENGKLLATVVPDNATYSGVIWESSDRNVVFVSSEGLLIARAAGTADITAITADGGKKAVCRVTVTDNASPVKKYTVSFDTAQGSAVASQIVAAGERAVLPAAPTKTGYVFDGWYLGAVKYNFDTAVDGDITLTARWRAVQTASRPVKVSGIKITGLSKKIAAGKKVMLTAAVTPANATDSSVTWAVKNAKDAKYVTVDAKTGLVSTKKAGKNKTVTIIATANDGSGKTAEYKIKIMPKAVKKITLKASAVSVKAGKKIRIKATVSPKFSAKKINKKLAWTSSNTAYATVNAKGVVKTKKAGKNKSVKITARATDGTNKKKVIKIKIK